MAENFGAIIQAARKEKAYSQAQLAQMAGLNSTYYSGMPGRTIGYIDLMY